MRSFLSGATATAFMVTAAMVPAGANAQESDAARDQNKRVCKSSMKTGSLVRRTKVCLTKREWNETENRSQETGRSMQDQLFVPPAL